MIHNFQTFNESMNLQHLSQNLEDAGILFDYIKEVPAKHVQHVLTTDKDKYDKSKVNNDIEKFERNDGLEDVIYFILSENKYVYALCV